MGWPYEFVTLSEDEKAIRREALDRYAFYAQMTAIMPVVFMAGARLALRFILEKVRARESRVVGTYDAVPASPALKSRKQTLVGRLEQKVREVQWWVGGELWLFGQRWGLREQWMVGLVRVIWLFSLCVPETGRDYLHLTKRFGIVAASQLPFQYAFALKSFSPFSVILSSSHESVNRYHRVLGRVILLLLLAHVAFYLNFFALSGLLMRRLFDPVVFAGVIAFWAFIAMNTTAMARVRAYSYRLFFLSHLAAAFAIPALLFFHAGPARLFVAESILVFVVDLAVRKVRTIKTHANLEIVPGTNLVKVAAAVPASKLANFTSRPGAHVYLSLPEEARPGHSPARDALYNFLFNPFTVAGVDEQSRQVILVARALDGPLTRRLADLAQAQAQAHSNASQPESGSQSTAAGPDGEEAWSAVSLLSDSKVSLNIEGPYGHLALNFASTFGSPSSALSSVDRTLLVAGGVGATFVLPVYRAILSENPSAKVDLVWAVRSASEATWAVSSPWAGDAQRNLLNDENVHIYVTENMDTPHNSRRSPPDQDSAHRRASFTSSSDAVDENVEMDTLQRDRRGRAGGAGALTASRQGNTKRPDLRRIVDETFRKGGEERVAVVVCGPAGMARKLRAHVGDWVAKGREVFWHDEGFGW